MRKQFFFSLLLALGLTAHAQQTDVDVQTGQFGANMKVGLCNDGPVTLVIDSEDLK